MAHEFVLKMKNSFDFIYGNKFYRATKLLNWSNIFLNPDDPQLIKERDIMKRNLTYLAVFIIAAQFLVACNNNPEAKTASKKSLAKEIEYKTEIHLGRFIGMECYDSHKGGTSYEVNGLEFVKLEQKYFARRFDFDCGERKAKSTIAPKSRAIVMKKGNEFEIEKIRLQESALTTGPKNRAIVMKKGNKFEIERGGIYSFSEDGLSLYSHLSEKRKKRYSKLLKEKSEELTADQLKELKQALSSQGILAVNRVSVDDEYLNKLFDDDLKRFENN